MSHSNNPPEKASAGTDKDVFERIYATPGAGWTLEQPPQDLVELCRSGMIRPPGKALDIGCGEGFYSIYLASLGFDVLGIDVSERAVEHARQNAKQADQKVAFEASTVANVVQRDEQFNFALEWSVLHHIEPSQRPGHAKQVAGLLLPGGRYLTLCFAADGDAPRSDSTFGVSPVGTKLYYSTAEGLRALYEPHFRILESKHSIIHGRHGQQHSAHYFFLEKRECL